MDRADVGLSDLEVDSTAVEFASDDFYRVLADTSRRRLLFALLTTERGTVDEFAELLYGWAATTGEQVNYERIRTALHHCHLPKLAAEGFVKFDSEAGTVERAELPEEVQSLIQQSIAAELFHGEA
ncbi:DUF7344 domain-containing protein [Halovenus halobia]|uniref:DUF7344 domain-containing protein n=1 Tax=Halovenus halobia TaxID=3396622 RepID=UPI003F56C482